MEEPEEQMEVEEPQDQTGKKQLKLTYEEYKKMSNVIIHHIRQKEEIAEASASETPEDSLTVLWGGGGFGGLGPFLGASAEPVLEAAASSDLFFFDDDDLDLLSERSLCFFLCFSWPSPAASLCFLCFL